MTLQLFLQLLPIFLTQPVSVPLGPVSFDVLQPAGSFPSGVSRDDQPGRFLFFSVVFHIRTIFPSPSADRLSRAGSPER
jgi:hypothetical protein